MNGPVDPVKYQHRDRRIPCPDRAELVDASLQSGMPSGVSLEWAFDRLANDNTTIRESA